MPGSPTAPGPRNSRAVAFRHVAFRRDKNVGARESMTFAARWLAYALPCRRFACALASADARLGADADRYSFIVSDLHRLLLAGLPAHYPLIYVIPKAPANVAFWRRISWYRSTSGRRRACGMLGMSS